MTMKAISPLLFILLCLSSAQEFQKLIDYTSKYNTFIADVYKELLKSHPGNFVACPSSVNIILSLCCTAAKEKTLEQLSAALHLPKRLQDIHDIFEPLTSKLRGPHFYYKLVSANKMYVSNDLRISDQFRTVATKVYDVDIQNVDLNDTDKSAKEINEWVNKKMYQTIKDVVEPNDLINSTHTVLVSAMLFGGRWAQPFYRSSTEKSCFYVSRKKCIVTDTMKHTLYDVRYYEIPKLDARLLEIPYSGGVSMFIVLPNNVEGLAALETRVGDVLVPLEDKYAYVEVTLPKFKIETDIEMKHVVEALGVSKAFEAGANFRGFGYYKNNTLIDKIIQKVSIEIDEDGATATVAEKVTGGAFGATGPIQFVKVFVDRPFLFYIRLNSLSYSTLNYNMFVGRYVTP